MNTYGITIEAQFIAKVDSDEWPHFEWRVTLTRDGLAGAGSGGTVKRVLPYKMGLGHIMTPCKKRIPIIRYRTTPCDHVRCQGKEVPSPPTLYDVLCSLKADDTQGQTFNEWCGDYGMEVDSRKAMDLYIACQQSEADSRAFFGSDWHLIVADEDYQ
jgi:hypothetical protein